MVFLFTFCKICLHFLSGTIVATKMVLVISIANVKGVVLINLFLDVKSASDKSIIFVHNESITSSMDKSLLSNSFEISVRKLVILPLSFAKDKSSDVEAPLI